jgi:hemerythrin-like domain-containing protein
MSKDEELIQRGLDLYRQLQETLSEEEWQELNESADRYFTQLIPEDICQRFRELEEEILRKD